MSNTYQIWRRPRFATHITRRTLIIVLCGIVLQTLVAQANHALAPWHVNFFVGGLLVAFPALRIGLREGFWAVFLLGLWLDATAPVPFGLHAFFFGLSHAILYTLRTRFPREETLIGVVIALITNFGLVLALSLALVHRNPAPAAAWLRILADSACSEILILLIAPWFFALQEQSLKIGGVGLRRDQRGLL